MYVIVGYFIKPIIYNCLYLFIKTKNWFLFLFLHIFSVQKKKKLDVIDLKRKCIQKYQH